VRRRFFTEGARSASPGSNRSAAEHTQPVTSEDRQAALGSERMDAEACGQPAENWGVLGRTTACEGQPQTQCRRCGEPIRGRRRNGYCSDRCRMRDHREHEAERRRELLTTIETSVAALRRELGDDDDPS
jgi:hypothetical protein